MTTSVGVAAVWQLAGPMQAIAEAQLLDGRQGGPALGEPTRSANRPAGCLTVRCGAHTPGRRVRSDRFSGKAQIEALDEARDAVGVHLEFVAGTEVRQVLRVGVSDAAKVDELREESLKAARRDDL